MSQTLTAAKKAYRDALAAYNQDIDQLIRIEKRLLTEFKASRGNEARCKTIVKQMDGVHAGVPAAEQRFHAAVDVINELIVTRFRAICSLPSPCPAGVDYLLQECKAFEKAKGEFGKRQSLYDGIVTVAAAVAGASEAKNEQDIPAEKLRVYDEFMQEDDPERKAVLYRENRAVILAVEHLKRLS
jgi:hypothetical protein